MFLSSHVGMCHIVVQQTDMSYSLDNQNKFLTKVTITHHHPGVNQTLDDVCIEYFRKCQMDSGRVSR